MKMPLGMFLLIFLGIVGTGAGLLFGSMGAMDNDPYTLKIGFALLALGTLLLGLLAALYVPLPR